MGRIGFTVSMDMQLPKEQSERIRRMIEEDPFWSHIKKAHELYYDVYVFNAKTQYLLGVGDFKYRTEEIVKEYEKDFKDLQCIVIDPETHKALDKDFKATDLKVMLPRCVLCRHCNDDMYEGGCWCSKRDREVKKNGFCYEWRNTEC